MSLVAARSFAILHILMESSTIDRQSTIVLKYNRPTHLQAVIKTQNVAYVALRHNKSTLHRPWLNVTPDYVLLFLSPRSYTHIQGEFTGQRSCTATALNTSTLSRINIQRHLATTDAHCTEDHEILATIRASIRLCTAAETAKRDRKQ